MQASIGDKVVFERRRKRTEADLLRQVREAPEAALLGARSDLTGLPLRQGAACQLTASAAAHLDECSRALKGNIEDPERLRNLLARAKEKNPLLLQPEAVPALVQMLGAGSAAVREILVGQLSRVEGKPASQALARIALFDLRPEIREQAAGALAARSRGEYLSVLLEGVAHPWPAVADHAAEALVALKAKEALPALVRLLDAPDPRAAYRKPGSKENFLKELVRINHVANCLVCHPSSGEPTDRPRAPVPSRGEIRGYYGGGDTFVRADITYLRQDFSVLLPIPSGQKVRFDFLVRERVATEAVFVDLATRPLVGPKRIHE